ncbi:MAG: histone deacetylase [Kiritimatiellae bacterium]|nr:histone deacetylase [Kiritimatiellia bacterium]
MYNLFCSLTPRRQFLKRLVKTFLAAAVCPACRARGEPATNDAQPKPTGLVYDPVYKKHLTGPRHPESPARYDAIVSGLSDAGLLKRLEPVPVQPVPRAALLACHTAGYLATVQRDVAAGLSRLSTGDTAICPDSLEAALAAAGGVLGAADAVAAGTLRNAFCVVRPPGHHASAERGMGFCLFNNVAVAARHVQKTRKLKKVLIVDWDVHHGNGTQDIFYRDGSVFYFSTHQSPWYPGTGRADETGEGDGAGTTLNCPFPAGAGRAEIVGAFRNRLVPAADEFRPDFVLISAGFDSRAGDPLGGFRLSDADFAELTGIVCAIARRHAGGRLVSVLEGGYELGGLASAAAAHVRMLLG